MTDRQITPGAQHAPNSTRLMAMVDLRTTLTKNAAATAAHRIRIQQRTQLRQRQPKVSPSRLIPLQAIRTTEPRPRRPRQKRSPTKTTRTHITNRNRRDRTTATRTTTHHARPLTAAQIRARQPTTATSFRHHKKTTADHTRNVQSVAHSKQPGRRSFDTAKTVSLG